MLRVTAFSRTRLALAAACAAGVLALFSAPAAAQEYTLNGQALSPEEWQMFAFFGLPPGAYYVDEQGNFGAVGQPPMMNIYAIQGQTPPAQQPAFGGESAQPAFGGESVASGGSDAAVVGARIFWVYSPSIFSSATGGSSGYIHVCPGNVFYRSSEGSISVGGEYRPAIGSDPTTGMNDSWAGMAHVAQSGGRWTLQQGDQGPEIHLNNSDGSVQEIPVSLIQEGRWKWGQTQYAVERGQASCG